jgi:hypothetical protein
MKFLHKVVSLMGRQKRLHKNLVIALQKSLHEEELAKVI